MNTELRFEDKKFKALDFGVSLGPEFMGPEE
jgi:hypothetical protein